MKLLALETATDACSVALLIDGDIRQDFRMAPREHVHLILPMIDAILAAAELTPRQLDAVAFGRGPGSFTGLRIAAGITQGIAFGADLPVAPVSTLAALAQGCVREHNAASVLAALDARMQEVYWGCYKRNREGLVELVEQERVSVPAAVTLTDSGAWAGAGSGWAACENALFKASGHRLNGVYPELYPQAREIAQLASNMVTAGQTVSAEFAQPVYLRDKVASKPGEKKRL